MCKYYGRIAAMLAVIALLAVLTVLPLSPVVGEDKPTVVTTVYPLYVAAKNVLGDSPAVKLENLTGSQAGCLHDYQLSPANRITLEKADAILLNGAGAEPFLEDILPKLTAAVTDTGAGISLLTAEGHRHDHHETEDGSHDETDAHDHEDNIHIWTSPSRYLQQVQAVADALCALPVEDTSVFLQNRDNYCQQVEAVIRRVEVLQSSLQGHSCVLLHDSLGYLAEDLGLEVAVSLTANGEGGLSAGDLAKAQQALKSHPDALLLYDGQYTTRYTALESLLPAKQVLTLDTAIRGDGDADDWLTAMNRNMTLFEQLLEE